MLVKGRPNIQAFTLIELVVSIAVIAILAVLFSLAMCRTPNRRGPIIHCVSNLKNIGLAYRISASANNDLFPGPYQSNEVAVSKLDAISYFAFLTNELSTPKILHCPADTDRKQATSFTNFFGKNISYFASLSSNPMNPMLWFSGDRNLVINGNSATPGQHTISTNDQVSWTARIHNKKGLVAMGDGSVQQLSQDRLQASLQESGDTNLLLFP